MRTKTGRYFGPSIFALTTLSFAGWLGCGGGGGDAANSGNPGFTPDGGADALTDQSVDQSQDVSMFDSSGGGGSDGGQQCVGGCTENQICSHGECVAKDACTTDNDCSNDSYCDGKNGCIPWGTAGKVNDSTCIYVIPPGIFSPRVRCEFSKAPDGDPFPNHTDVQATPMVANFNRPVSSGPPSIIVPFTATVVGGYTENQGVIRILRGTDCSVEANLGGTDVDGDGVVDWVGSPQPVAIGDLDLDGVPEVVATGGDGSLLAFTRKAGTWSLLWKAKNSDGSVFKDGLFNWATVNPSNWAGPSIHDLDNDGKPEIIREGYVVSSAGVLLSGLPAGYVTYNVGMNPVLANLDQDPGIELANGQYIWEWKSGAWVQEPGFPSTTSGPGLVAVADFGAYGTGLPSKNPELVVVRANTVGVFAVDGSIAFGPLAMPGGGGGNPTIADYDGDGLPEVGVAGADYYTVFDIDCTNSPRPTGKCQVQARCDDATGVPGKCPEGILWSRKTQDHSSNITGSSVFDFEADGKAEVVYADECFVRVYNGSDGDVLFSQYRSSCTWYENPVVADVDGNFRADLVVPSNLACSDGTNGIACGVLDSNGVDGQFAGLRCKSNAECASGICEDNYCRCSVTAECCSAHDDAKCLEAGQSCAPAPAAIGGSNTCRAPHPHGVRGIRVYSDAADKWVRSRSIWNQHAYAVTNISEEGVVPKTSDWKNNWEQPGLNNFRQNVPGTPNGQATSDPTAGASSSFSCDSSGVSLNVPICNRGADAVGAGLTVSFYDGTSQVCKTKTKKALQPGECETISCVWAKPPTTQTGAKDITVIVNEDKTTTECKGGNNKGTVKTVFCKPIT